MVPGKHGSCRRRQTYLDVRVCRISLINENAYVNASNVAGMGAVVAAQPSGLAGQTLGNYANGVGSGDIGQNLYQ
jgi:hypothetical protein